jgi:hypothetical protein
VDPQSSDSPYVNYNGFNNISPHRSNINPPPNYSNEGRERLSSRQSDRKISTAGRHSTRSSIAIRGSTHDQLNNNHTITPSSR